METLTTLIEVIQAYPNITEISLMSLVILVAFRGATL